MPGWLGFVWPRSKRTVGRLPGQNTAPSQPSHIDSYANKYDVAPYHARMSNRALDRIDRHIASTMQRIGIPALRYSLAVIFIWFGILKPLGISPAEDLLLKTVDWLPLFNPSTWLHIIGWWEVAIGITFLSQKTVRIAIALLALQMVGTFMPLVILSNITFQPGRIPYAPTLEGQYIIKNLLIISAALAIGGTARRIN